jgi:hypothetical protein
VVAACASKPSTSSRGQPKASPPGRKAPDFRGLFAFLADLMGHSSSTLPLMVRVLPASSGFNEIVEMSNKEKDGAFFELTSTLLKRHVTQYRGPLPRPRQHWCGT